MSRPDRHPPVPVLDLRPELAEVGPALEAAFRRVVASGQFILGPEVEAFEREVAAFLGVRHAVGVNSGTDALILALEALGVGPGDEVVTSPFSFFATAEAVSFLGATPVFADIDPETFALRPDLAERAVTSRTRALLPVHLFGLAADLDAFLELGRRTGLPVVEDVAQAFGGRWRGRRLGALGRAGAYSFFPSKNLGGLGDGGLVATDDGALAETVRVLRAHGGRRKYENERVGMNSRLDALQAAFLRAKLPHVDAWNAARREAAGRYQALLRGAPGLALPAEREGAEHVYHQFTVRVTGGRRDAVQAALAEEGVATMVYYPRALHELPIYAGAALRFAEAERARAEVLSLPLWPRLDPEVQAHVAAALRRALGG